MEPMRLLTKVEKERGMCIQRKEKGRCVLLSDGTVNVGSMTGKGQ